MNNSSASKYRHLKWVLWKKVYELYVFNIKLSTFGTELAKI